jgi:hypothetical protein
MLVKTRLDFPRNLIPIIIYTILIFLGSEDLKGLLSPLLMME